MCGPEPEATIAAGCGINEAKSELVLPPKYQNEELNSKTELVWLGYSLKLTDDLRVMFTDTKMLARVKKSLGMARSVFQYIKSIYVRWRIFKVYIAPIIEWYLPTMAHKSRTAGAKNNVLESFQHQLLAMVTGVCSSCSREELEKTVGEMSVRMKMAKMGARMQKYVFRDTIQLLVGSAATGNF